MAFALRKIHLERFFRPTHAFKEDLHHAAESIGRLLITKGYDKEKLFSGNVDARKIRETAEDYGFVIADHDTEKSKNGQRLLQVKTKRNDLAHGKISFEDCGHECSIDELTEIFSEVVAFLDAVLRGVEDFVNNAKYLQAPVAAPVQLA